MENIDKQLVPWGNDNQTVAVTEPLALRPVAVLNSQQCISREPAFPLYHSDPAISSLQPVYSSGIDYIPSYASASDSRIDYCRHTPGYEQMLKVPDISIPVVEPDRFIDIFHDEENIFAELFSDKKKDKSSLYKISQLPDDMVDIYYKTLSGAGLADSQAQLKPEDKTSNIVQQTEASPQKPTLAIQDLISECIEVFTYPGTLSEKDFNAKYLDLTLRVQLVSDENSKIVDYYFNSMLEYCNKSPADNTFLIAHNIYLLGCPSSKILKKILKFYTHPPEDKNMRIDNTALLLFSLINFERGSELELVNNAGKKIIKSFIENNMMLQQLSLKIVRTIIGHLSNNDLLAEETQTQIKYQLNRLKEIYHYADLEINKHYVLRQGLNTLSVLTDPDYATNSFPASRAWELQRLRMLKTDRSFCSEVDLLLMKDIVTMPKCPKPWMKIAGDRLLTAVMKVGHNGNYPLSAISVILFHYDRISSAEGAKAFEQIFPAMSAGSNIIKPDEQFVTLISLFVNRIHHENFFADTFNSSHEQAEAIFMPCWNSYKELEAGAPPYLMLTTKQAKVWRDIADTVVHYCATSASKGAIQLLTVMLKSPPKNDDRRLSFYHNIVSANMSETLIDTKIKLKKLNARLTELITETPGNNVLLCSVAAVQLSMLDLAGNACPIELVDDLIANFAATDNVSQIKNPLSQLKQLLLDGKIDSERYLHIISRAVEQSWGLNPQPVAQVVRIKLVNSASETLQQLDQTTCYAQLFNALAPLKPQLEGDGKYKAYEIAGYKSLPDIVNPMLSRKPSAAIPLSDADRQACVRFVTAHPTNWQLAENACKELKQALDISLLFNPQQFIQADATVQALMLDFYTQTLKQPPSDFINHCLEKLADQQTPSLYPQSVRALNAICQFLQRQDSVSSELTGSLYNVYTCLQQKQLASVSLMPIKKSLQQIVAKLTVEQQSPYQQLFIDNPNDPFIQTEFKHDAEKSSFDSGSRRPKRKDLTAASAPVASTSLEPSVRPKEPQNKRTLYISNQCDWNQLKAELDMQDNIKLFMDGYMLDAFNFHKDSKNPHDKTVFYRIDLVSHDKQNIEAKLTGRTDYRALIAQTSGNKFYLVGIGSHDEIKVLRMKYKHIKTKKDVSRLIKGCRELQLNKETYEVELKQ